MDVAVDQCFCVFNPVYKIDEVVEAAVCSEDIDIARQPFNEVF